MKTKGTADCGLFTVTFEALPEEGWFEIFATEKETGRISDITTLNYILGQIIYSVLNPDDDESFEDVEDSPVEVKDMEKLNELVRLTTHCFNDVVWLHKLQSALIEDFGCLSDHGF